MRIDFPDSGFDYIKTNLKRGIADHQSFRQSLEILYVAPELARTDSEIRDLVVKVLSTKYYGFRIKAALVLHAIGDPLGILHLTYNSLRSHPILMFDHTKTSGWHEYVIQHAEDFNDQCIDLLVADMMGNFACFHGRTLAQLSAETIVPRMLPLLEEGGKTAQYAAFVLAAKGYYDDVPDILENWLRSDMHPKYPLQALAYLRGNKALSIAKEFADSSHALYNYGKYQDSNKYFILPFAQYVQDVIETDSTARAAKIIEKYFQQNITQLMTFNPASGRYDQRFNLRNPIEFIFLGSTGVSATEFLSDHANQQEREMYAGTQNEAVIRLFQENALDYEQLQSSGANQFMHFNALPDTGHRDPGIYGTTNMRIYFDEADYQFAAIDWLLHPHRYLNSD